MYDDFVDIGLLLLEVINLGDEEDYKETTGIKLNLINFLLNSYAEGSRDVLQIYKPLLTHLLKPNDRQVWGVKHLNG